MCRLCSHNSPDQKSSAGFLPMEGGSGSSSCSNGDTEAGPITLTIYSTPKAIPKPSGQRPVKPKNPPAKGRSNFRTFSCSLNLLNPMNLSFFPLSASEHNPPPTGGHNLRGQRSCPPTSAPLNSSKPPLNIYLEYLNKGI